MGTLLLPTVSIWARIAEKVFFLLIPVLVEIGIFGYFFEIKRKRLIGFVLLANFVVIALFVALALLEINIFPLGTILELLVKLLLYKLMIRSASIKKIIFALLASFLISIILNLLLGLAYYSFLNRWFFHLMKQDVVLTQY